MNDQPGQPANPFAAIGLPPSWQPVAVGWAHAKLDVMGPDGRNTLNVLIFDGPTGRAGYAFTDDDLRKFLDAMNERLSGLSVARAVVPPNGKFFRPVN